MIVRTLYSRHVQYRRLIDCRQLSCLSYAKKPVLGQPLNDKNNALRWRQPDRSVSSASTVAFPSWFVALSNSTPVAYAQQFVISFHEVTGTPWWASIVLSAVALRLVVTLPLTVYQVGNILLLNCFCFKITWVFNIWKYSYRKLNIKIQKCFFWKLLFLWFTYP